MQPWFLDTVCDENSWNVCLDFEKNGSIQGILIYHIVEKWGFKILKMPPLLPAMPLWIKDDPTWKNEHRLSFEKTVLQNLIAQLPKSVFSLQFYPPTFKNWLPFWWAGYRIEPMLNYVIDNVDNLTAVWDNMKSATRRKIHKAQNERFKVEKSDDIEAFYTLFLQTINRVGFKTHTTESLLVKLHTLILVKKTGQIYFVKDKSNVVVAALYVLFDGKTGYYWIPTMNEKAGNSGATSLLMWEVLNDLSQQRITQFKATGSMLPNLEAFITAFGATQETYWKMTKYGNQFMAFLHLLKRKT
jgi:hypothetical protein